MPAHLTRIVRNQSDRTAPIRIIVLHTTEGANRPGVSDLEGLASYFDNPASEASAHKGIDADGNIITMVKDNRKAWTCAGFNSVSLNIEQLGFAAETKRAWIVDHHAGLRAVARQIAHWSILHGIPIRHSTAAGICQHKDLGELGGGHDDCGPGYPEAYVRLWGELWKKRFLGTNHGVRANAIKARIVAQQRRYGNRHGTA